VDGGKTWTSVDKPEYYDVTALAASSSGSSIVLATDHAAVIRSTDAGNTWQALAVPTVGAVRSVWTDGKAILVGGDHGEIWRGP